MPYDPRTETQAQRELRTMRADLDNATTLDDLRQLAAAWMPDRLIEDGETADSLRGDLGDYIAEFRAECVRAGRPC